MSFPHLSLREKFSGKPKYGKFTPKDSQRSKDNLSDRIGHSRRLQINTLQVESEWKDKVAEREREELPELPDTNVVPILLEVDPGSFDIESLVTYNIEIISEEEDGYILGASVDNFQGLLKKISDFEQEKRDNSGRVKNKSQSRLWSIVDGSSWKIDHILSDSSKDRWSEIKEDEILVLDIGIACYLKLRDFPQRLPRHTDESYQVLVESWQSDKVKTQEKRDEIADNRKDNFAKFITDYDGQIIEGPVDTEDSFGFRVRISGKALRDIVINYQYVFDVVEVEGTDEDPTYAYTRDIDFNLEFMPPSIEDPTICVIDSGIMEGHRYISLAIDSASSFNFIDNNNDVADYAAHGGHGTRVAGAVLFPKNIPTHGKYQLPFWIQNARVLDENNQMPAHLYPPKLMRDIVNKFPDTRIFNLSVNYKSPCRLTHMSAWAATIDQLTWEKDIIFVISTGNLPISSALHSSCQGVKDHISFGRHFPEYFQERGCRISNPGQSSFAITVGSISGVPYEDDRRISISTQDSPSAFTKIGLGLWGTVKPDVVEYGGDLVKTKYDPLHVFSTEKTSPHLIRSTLHGGGALGYDAVGTSYTAPKVANILGQIQKALPEESALMYRALLAQSARLTNNNFRNPDLTHIRTTGYGLPDVERATGNSDNRITFIKSSVINSSQIHIYSIVIPDELNKPGDDFDVMIEVTLSYKARPRRTRRRTRSYLSIWLDWESSKLDDTFEKFRDRVVNMPDEYESASYMNTEEYFMPNSSIPWSIHQKIDSGKIKDIRRQDSTLQKDWFITESHKLPKEFFIAVRGHKGWDKDPYSKVPYSIVLSFESLNSEVPVYESIRAVNEVEIQIPRGY